MLTFQQPGRGNIRPSATIAYDGPIFIDAFAGCGGLSLGLMRAGWRGLFAVEKDRFAFETLKANFLTPGARHSYAWPDWLEQRPWCVEELLKEYRSELSN